MPRQDVCATCTHSARRVCTAWRVPLSSLGRPVRRVFTAIGLAEDGVCAPPAAHRQGPRGAGVDRAHRGGSVDQKGGRRGEDVVAGRSPAGASPLGQHAHRSFRRAHPIVASPGKTAVGTPSREKSAHCAVADSLGSGMCRLLSWLRRYVHREHELHGARCQSLKGERTASRMQRARGFPMNAPNTPRDSIVNSRVPGDAGSGSGFDATW
jgi:hypothetical protein